jgi:hypothetical protein
MLPPKTNKNPLDGVIFFKKVKNIIAGLSLGSAIIVLVGVLDDIFSLSPKTKLLGQLAAAMILVSFGIGLEFITNPFDGIITLGFLSIPFTYSWGANLRYQLHNYKEVILVIYGLTLILVKHFLITCANAKPVFHPFCISNDKQQAQH